MSKSVAKRFEAPRHQRPRIVAVSLGISEPLPRGMALPLSGHDVGTAKVLPLVSRHLDPLALLELRNFVHLRLIYGHLAVLVADPKVYVVNLILGSNNTKVSTGKVMTVIVELPNRLVGVDKL